MEYNEIIAGMHLVEQVRRPQDTDALFGDELADMAQDVGARLDVKTDGRFVKQKEARPM
jgi:hypothetical protein